MKTIMKRIIKIKPGIIILAMLSLGFWLFVPFCASAEEESRFGARGIEYAGKKRIAAASDLAVAAGLGWSHMGLGWKVIEPTPPTGKIHNYEWQLRDAQIESELNRNMNIVVLTACNSSWGSVIKNGCTAGIPAPDHISDYQEYMRNIVERYDGDGVDDAPFITSEKNIKYWVVENEPGGNMYWCGTASEYVELFRLTEEAIKTADPQAKVSMAGFGSNTIMDKQIFPDILSGIKNLNVNFDFFAFHNYKRLSESEPSRIPEVYKEIQRRLKEYGFGEKEAWLTETNFEKVIIADEFGTNDPNSIDKEDFDKFVASHLVKRYAFAFSTGVKKVFVYDFMDFAAWPSDDSTNYWGLVDINLVPKIVYTTHATMVSKLKGFTKAEQINVPGYYRFDFYFTDKTPVYILWTEGEPVNADLGLGEVKVTDIYGTESAKDSSSLTLTDSPIFIEEIPPSEDTTPPTRPLVTDAGSYVNTSDRLYASWISSDPESGITEYQYEITQDSCQGPMIREWSSAGTANYVTAGELSLTDGKSYYFGVKVKNGAGLESSIGYSDGIVFDATAPETQDSGIDALWHNSPVTITLNASDTISGIDKTYYSTDGSDPLTLYTGPFTISGNGIYTIKYYSLDKAANPESIKTAANQVKIDVTAPAISIVSPSNGTTVSGTINVSADASDNIGVVGVQFKLDGVNLGSEEASPPYSIPWDTTTASRGSHTLTAIARDSAGNSITANALSLVVFNNNLPVLAPIGDKSINEGSVLRFSILATDPDKDTLIYSAGNLPLGAGFNASSKEFSWTPSYFQAGAYNVTFRVSDGNGGSASAAIAITVNNVNQAPVLHPIADIKVNEGEKITISPSASDADGDSLNFSYSGWMNSNTYTTTYNDIGVHTVHVTVSDDSLTDSQDVTITVVHVDIVVPPIPVVTVEQARVDGNVQLNASWSSSDSESDNFEYKYRVTKGSPRGTVIRDWTSVGNNTSVTVADLKLQAGEAYYVSVKAKNDAGLESEAGHSDELKVNRPPQVIGMNSSSNTLKPNRALNFTATFSDEDGSGDIKVAEFLVIPYSNKNNFCLIYYNQNTGKLYLRNGTREGGWIGGYELGSNNLIENSDVILDCSKTTVSSSDNALTINWNLVFKPNFIGINNGINKIYLNVKDNNDVATGWIRK
jgi:hypothetical protein